MDKKTMRLVLDVVLTVLLVVEMLYSLTGNALHEVLGLVFCLCIAGHLALSATWIRSMAQSLSKRQVVRRNVMLGTMAAVLAVVTVLLVLSSVAISRLLGGLNDGLTSLLTYPTWYTMHVVTSYGLSALVLVHLVMHWQVLAKWLHVPYNPERRTVISNCANAAAGLGAVALCVTCFGVLNSVGPGKGRGKGGFFGQDRGGSQGESQGMPPFGGPEGSSDQGQGESDRGPGGRGWRDQGERPEWGEDGQRRDPGDGRGGQGSQGGREAGGGWSGADGQQDGDICYLCRKRCPLSAPKCDLPYEQGLIER
ncbi:MAG: DUF4405 domain-containing protein [Coriobacteriia bacterium]|nr:DUF4405 domain-containing protein [Coriobacteriia bacterium]